MTSAVIRTISVTPANATLAAGQTQQYTAIATLSDGTQQTETSSAHWSVSDSTRRPLVILRARTGQQLQLLAIGNYSDGTTQNLTSSVTCSGIADKSKPK